MTEEARVVLVELEPLLERRLQTIEKRLQLAESELKGGIDLSEFYAKPGEEMAPPESTP